jgi:glutaminase
VALCTVDGQRHVIGDVDVPFTIQSGGRPVNYALAINELGEDAVHQFVGHEPSDEEATTAYVRLDRDGKPPNPLVNAGALVIASLLRSGSSLDSRYESTLAEYRRLTGGGHVSFNNSLLLEEHDVADHNQAIGYFLRQNRCFPAGVNLHETLDLYFQLCSTEITADSGSVIAATLANGGYCPTTGEQVCDAIYQVL